MAKMPISLTAPAVLDGSYSRSTAWIGRSTLDVLAPACAGRQWPWAPPATLKPSLAARVRRAALGHRDRAGGGRSSPECPTSPKATTALGLGRRQRGENLLEVIGQHDWPSPGRRLGAADARRFPTGHYKHCPGPIQRLQHQRDGDARVAADQHHRLDHAAAQHAVQAHAQTGGRSKAAAVVTRRHLDLAANAAKRFPGGCLQRRPPTQPAGFQARHAGICTKMALGYCRTLEVKPFSVIGEHTAISLTAPKRFLMARQPPRRECLDCRWRSAPTTAVKYSHGVHHVLAATDRGPASGALLW